MSKDINRILIADDSEMNRAMLAEMLGKEYEILEAVNGEEAIAMLHQYEGGISLIMLDIMMPVMDGFEVLAFMNKNHWIEEVPVIMISSENSAEYVEKAYELGVTDYININKPYNALIVYRRVRNTIMLYARQRKLAGMVRDQIYEKEKNESLMINILSHIVEFRNGESGLHVLHINTITGLLLDSLVQKTDKYNLSWTDRSLITTASALHDIGKIGIDDKILNKPGRLTAEEFEIMKTHSMIGASMLENLEQYKDEPLVKFAYQICRWHHERYDGKGYPDGLKGEEIPISAQVVSMADVYDALTSERVYKKAFSHEKAMEMILAGECGTFNPLLLECLEELQDEIQEQLKEKSPGEMNKRQTQHIAEEVLQTQEISASERTRRLLEYERMKYHFFVSMSKEMRFEYSVSPAMLTFTKWASRTLGVKEINLTPDDNEELMTVIGRENMKRFDQLMRKTSVDKPIIETDVEMNISGKMHTYRVITRVVWSEDEVPEYMGCIGKIIDIYEDHKDHTSDINDIMGVDIVTGVYTQYCAKKKIQELLEVYPDKKFILMLIDLDSFSNANREYGHLFGDQVLRYVGDVIRKNVDTHAVEARAGGDEFLVFQEYTESSEEMLRTLSRNLNGFYRDFSISVSIGAARTEKYGMDYESLFQYADQALSAAKKSGTGDFRFYDESMAEMFSAISPID